MFGTLVLRSLWNRRLATVLTVCSIGLSVALLLGVERAREATRTGFTQSISGVDLIVGAKGGAVNLLLYSVFRLGTPTENIEYETYQKLTEHPDIDWVIPYSLGDSYDIYRVVGTSPLFFQHFKYGAKQSLAFREGEAFGGLFDVVLGAEVATKKGLKLGDPIVLSHGAEVGEHFQKHDNLPFVVKGVLKATGTPVDKGVYISLKGMTAIHVGWEDGGPPIGEEKLDKAAVSKMNLAVDSVTALFVKTKSPFKTLHLQRWVNEYKDEPLMAVIPGVVLVELWETLAYAEGGLKIISILVVFVGLVTMLIAIYNTLGERRREMAILRSIGASPGLVFLVLVGESLFMTLTGIALGFGLLSILAGIVDNFAAQAMGVQIGFLTPLSQEVYYLLIVVAVGGLLGLIPAVRAYRNTLSDGLTIRL